MRKITSIRFSKRTNLIAIDKTKEVLILLRIWKLLKRNNKLLILNMIAIVEALTIFLKTILLSQDLKRKTQN